MTNSALLDIADYISLSLRITVVDGRILHGILVAVDDQANLLLTEVVEFFNNQLKDEITQRQIGLVSVPRDTISKIEMDKNELLKTVQWKQAR